MIPLKDDNPRSSFPIFTILLIIINIIVFYFEATTGYTQLIERFGAVPGQIVRGQKLETLITSMFLHGGFMHIIGNMLYLWIFGDNIEHYLGHFKFLLFYFTCGLIAVIAHIILGSSPDVPMVGASGAISGVLGAYLIKYPKARILVLIPIFIFITIRPIPAVIVLSFWFIMQLFSGLGTLGISGGGVAFWAHIGGFIAGAVLILVLAKKNHKQVIF